MPCLAAFDAASATQAEIRARIVWLFERQTAELNACHQGPADYIGDQIRELEAEHFRRCYEAPRETQRS